MKITVVERGDFWQLHFATLGSANRCAWTGQRFWSCATASRRQAQLGKASLLQEARTWGFQPQLQVLLPNSRILPHLGYIASAAISIQTTHSQVRPRHSEKFMRFRLVVPIFHPGPSERSDPHMFTKNLETRLCKFRCPIYVEGLNAVDACNEFLFSDLQQQFDKGTPLVSR